MLCIPEGMVRYDKVWYGKVWSGMVRYALHVTYTSLQSYKAFIFQNFRFQSFSFLHKIQQRGVDSLKSVKRSRECIQKAKL